MKVMVFMGAPGAGKGTAAEGICRATGCRHVSTGDLLRGAIAKRTPLGLRAEEFVKQGGLVPDDLMIGLVDEQFDGAGDGTLFLLDGFPRTLDQARRLDTSLRHRGGRVDYVFLLESPREVLVQRLSGRRLCRACGAGYHVTNIPPKRAGVCDRCGGDLYQRPDDEEATILRRLKVFEEQSADLLAYYASQGVLHRLDSSLSKEDTESKILGILGGGGLR